MTLAQPLTKATLTQTFMPVALPTFTKLGAVLSRPQWMIDLEIPGPYFPRLIENDLYRANLPNLPASRFSVLYSTDHASGTGYIGRVDFDDIELDWNDYGDFIHAGVNQRETPHPVYDPENNRINVYVHDNVSSVPFGRQATVLLTSTNLQSLTEVGEVFDQGLHTGYAQIYRVDDKWHASSVFTNGTFVLRANWVSDDPASFSDPKVYHSGLNNIFADDEMNNGQAVYFQWRGVWWMANCVGPRPQTGTNSTAIIGCRVTGPGGKPIEGYRILVEPGDTDADDRYISSGIDIQEIDGTLYIIYVGWNTALEHKIMLAKADTDSEASVVPFNRPTSNLTGSVLPDTDRNGITYWDAANDALPAGWSVVTVAGTNASVQVPGQYYELKTGSGVAQNLYLQGPAFDNLTNKTIDLEFENLRWSINDSMIPLITWFGLLEDPIRPRHGAKVEWMRTTKSFGTTEEVWFGHPTETVAYLIDLYAGGSVGDFQRQFIYKRFTLRLEDYGRRLTILINGQPAFTKNTTATISTSQALRPVLGLRSQSPFQQVFARFSGVKVRTYDADDTPPVLPGPVAEFDAGYVGDVLNVADPETQATNGQTVAKWLSRIDSDDSGLQANNSYKPTFTTNAQNGLGAVTFSGFEQWIEVDTLAPLFEGVARPLTVIVAAKTNAIGAAQSMFSLGKSTDATNYLTLSVAADGSLFLAKRGNTSAGITGSPTAVATSAVIVDTNWHLYSFVLYGKSVDAYFDGVKVIDNAAFDCLELFGLNRGSIGMLRRSNFSAYWNGQIGYVGVYNYATPDSIREAKQTAIATRWGISL